LICLGLILLLMIAVYVFKGSDKYPNFVDDPSEMYYKDGDAQKPFPSLDDEPTKTFSIIVPAYNEEERLPAMLDECLEYMEQRRGGTSCVGAKGVSYEVIVVDDGSRDDTVGVVARYTQKHGADTVRCLQLARNRGKGGAVRMGMRRARGAVVLFADADGATKFPDFALLEERLAELTKDTRPVASALAIVCGSRAHLQEQSKAERSVFRTLLMVAFHALVWLLAVRTVADTQCGFKLLTRRAARLVFGSVHLEGWAFDVEMLTIAERLGVPVAEVAVRWTEIDGSKITPILSWLEMGRDIAMIWLRYWLGVWLVRGE